MNLTGPDDEGSQKVEAGCGNCKRRRTKGDGVRPTCHNCTKFSVPCDFDPASSETWSAQTAVPGQRRRRRPRKNWANVTSNPRSHPASLARDLPLSSFGIDDMELLYHYLTDPIF
ncbi:hypothetical protein VTI74DRAFT_1893 [Chaetomium olivicolor]